MLNAFYRNRQLLILTLILVVVWGVSALFTLPRMEDPEITQRNAQVVTFLPEATPERVESLVTEPLENRLLELEEIDALTSSSGTGISIISVALKESIRNVDPVWARVRSKIDDAVPELPPEASDPEYRDSNVSASALIVGLTWELPGEPNYVILGRLAQSLQERLRSLPGTGKVERFGQPDEEIRVDIAASDLARLGLTAQALSQQIAASDAKVAAGQIRSDRSELLLEVNSALDSLERIRAIPIQVGERGAVARLGEIAQVSQGVQDPAAALAYVGGHAAVGVAATVESQYRVDAWAQAAQAVLAEFEATLSDGLGLRVVLDQSQYVQQRLNGVIGNLISGSLLVVAVSWLMLGGKAALLVGAALPLTTLMVLGWMQGLGVPLHQMSVTGLIIALGLLIDNAIVVVEEVQGRLKAGLTPSEAVSTTVQHLFVPLLASTLTTVLAFVPIATSSGSTGEFIGTIGLTVILALISSLFLSLTVIAALAGRLHRWHPLGAQAVGWNGGLSSPVLTAGYRWTLQWVLRHPWSGVALALVLPVVGFAVFGSLEQQFFPPTNRDQFQIEVQLPQASAMTQTQSVVLAARDRIRHHDAVTEVHWFLGKSAPAFFYNVVNSQENAPYYAQGIVQLKGTEQVRETIQALQADLDSAFPDAQILVKQLEQGPPFEAPIELRLYGPDTGQLREIGNTLRAELSQLATVTHTRASLSTPLPKLALQVDEEQARRAGVDHQAIAQQLQTTLNGTVGGSILDATETVPVRVRVPNDQRGHLDPVTSLDLVAANGTVPLSALATVTLEPDLATITRRNGQRLNTVLGFLSAGSLPDTVLTQFQQQLAQQHWQLPSGYRLEYGGEADARGDAIANLLSTVGLLGILMTATLVLSFNSFGLAALIGSVALLSVGLAALALKLFGSLFGFTAILGTLGLIGLAINDSIVVLAALRDDPAAREGNPQATEAVVMDATRHVLATTLTTITGFIPLILDRTGFWPPLAIAIAGGLGGATLLALFYIPAAHLLMVRGNHPLAHVHPPI
ncbi:AcrB/AcrD/AcrF family protein [Synechococcales cyanobacterium C]|uniref:AcrB/AcrD/AcrF family protein n=1 Tax=Petrachloros mirabilis ULC683 TaxID=2781853 RepID=A0A8K2A117_9CYAN|nr:efflux RND transporter permease subunit [Petrachloros mirabilis]NCJ07417.1 AcrB/AcrD/AcrF family protein [Petrachloros mirabilis ULC683]